MTITRIHVEQIVTRTNGGHSVVCRLQTTNGEYLATVHFKWPGETEHVERLQGLDTPLGRWDADHNDDFDVAEFLLDAMTLRG